MNTNDLNTALYEKMAAEQDKFRDWLKSQPPEEILHHTYEYTVREDIVMAMEELELTDAQAKALLESPSPLADVYRYFEKLETGYMDVIRDSIENRADDVCRAKEELRTTPIYPHSAAYAREHGELEQYRASNTKDTFRNGGNPVRGHEFHYFDSTDCGSAWHAAKPLRKRNWECIHATKRMMAGFPHLYYMASPHLALEFLEQCVSYRKEQEKTR